MLWWLFWIQVFVALEDPATLIILIEDTLVLPVLMISWLVVIFLWLRQVGDITASQWPVKPWPFVLCCRVGLTAFRSAVIFAIVIIILVLSRLKIEASGGRCIIILNLIVIALVVESIVFDWGVEKWVACNYCIYSFVGRTKWSRRCTVILVGNSVFSSFTGVFSFLVATQGALTLRAEQFNLLVSYKPKNQCADLHPHWKKAGKKEEYHVVSNDPVDIVPGQPEIVPGFILP